MITDFKEYGRQWRAKNREKVIESNRQWRMNNQSRVKFLNSLQNPWRVANKDKRKIYNSKKHLEHFTKLRDLINYLKNIPCTDCHIKYDPCAMDFDHLDPSMKTFGIGSLKTRTAEKIFEEVKKCEVVCANCHRVRTKRQREKGMFYIGFRKVDDSQLKFL